MSKNVSSTCADGPPRACSSSIARGRTDSSISRMPRAIAPEVTTTTSSPARWRSATASPSASSSSLRTSPASSATTLEPSFTTTVATALALRPVGQLPSPVLALEPEEARRLHAVGVEHDPHGGLVAIHLGLPDGYEPQAQVDGPVELLPAGLVGLVALGEGRLLDVLVGEELAAQRLAVALVRRLDEVAHRLPHVVRVVASASAAGEGEEQEQQDAGHAPGFCLNRTGHPGRARTRSPRSPRRRPARSRPPRAP